VILAAADIATPPEGVFGALTTAEEVIRWWGSPETYKTEAWAADLRIGGLWKAEGRGADGTLFSLSGAILELDPPHKFVQTWKSDWDGGHETKLTYRLHAIDGGTRLTLRHAGFVDRPEACQDHANGWEAVLNWLRAHFTPASSSANERFYMCRLMPPRPSFARDMTAEETAVMQEHGAYWRKKLRDGVAIVFGPVADPKGVWGLVVLRATSDEAARALEAADPAVRSGKGFHYDTLPMVRAVASA
jgi:uncharacterized protein YndB with AHSA1/START domain